MGKEILFFCELVLGGQETEKFTSGTILKEEVEFTVVLKTHFHANQKGMLDLCQNLLFGHNVFLLIFFEDVLLLQFFKGIKLVVLEVADKHHFCIGALADD